MKNSCSIDKGKKVNIIYRCEKGTISNDPPATIIGLEVPRQ